MENYEQRKHKGITGNTVGGIDAKDHSIDCRLSRHVNKPRCVAVVSKIIQCMSTTRKPSSAAHKERYEGKHNNGGRVATKRDAERRPSTRQDSFKKFYNEGRVPSTSRTPRDGSQHTRTGDRRESSKHRKDASRRDSSSSSDTDTEKSSRRRGGSRRRRSKSRSRSLDDSRHRTSHQAPPRRRPKSATPPREHRPYYADAQRERDRLKEKYGREEERHRSRRRSYSRESRRRSRTPVRETTKIVTVPVPVYPTFYPDGSMYEWYNPTWPGGHPRPMLAPPPMRPPGYYPPSPFMVDPFHRPMRPGMAPLRPFQPPQGFPPSRFHRPH